MVWGAIFQLFVLFIFYLNSFTIVTGFRAVSIFLNFKSVYNSSLLRSNLSKRSKWLFFQNVIQVQPQGGKNPIELYQEMWLQVFRHVSQQPTAATMQRFNWSGPPHGTHKNN